MYLYIKAIHIIFVVCWMAGLFYAVRLFIYHTEAKGKAEYPVLHKQFMEMERKLWWIITTPAMYLTVSAGLGMLHLNPALLTVDWMQVKLLFVAGLLIYHFICQRIMYKLAGETCTWKSGGLRMWNEVATLFLFAIVFLVVLKHSLNWIYGVGALIALALVLMLAIRFYKKIRK